ncbi:MAG: hypothetical protein HY040_13320 [Planctomycetes bacterium]|nr:hypothetical protein [Planctomycetota bacterium]
MFASRAASLLVALGYLIAALFATEGRDGPVVILGAVLLLPLALIWLADVFGNYVGPISRGGSKTSSGSLFLARLLGMAPGDLGEFAFSAVA